MARARKKKSSSNRHKAPKVTAPAETPVDTVDADDDVVESTVSPEASSPPSPPPAAPASTPARVEYVEVRVGRLPGTLSTINLPVGKRSVADALATAGISASGGEIRVNGGVALLTQELALGDTVFVLQRIAGNR